MEDVSRLFLENEDRGLSTQEIIDGLQRAGFDVDKRWFWDEIAPKLMGGKVTEYLGDKVTGTVH
ncbi:MAG: hypothetical protein EOS65_02640 [Mesorhizobium sp.]|uniref:hypothetical protein n=1 Tax=Mesorhizobium sp. TaxID=1871066 RepID=UPI000FE93C98|nr:hypothetical protein [Mesorhizobium sp.]RWF44292.1 MAG: hypothetical protein EOS65_02640 [Mesorhizobium sp.]